MFIVQILNCEVWGCKIQGNHKHLAQPPWRLGEPECGAVGMATARETGQAGFLRKANKAILAL